MDVADQQLSKYTWSLNKGALLYGCELLKAVIYSCGSKGERIKDPNFRRILCGYTIFQIEIL